MLNSLNISDNFAVHRLSESAGAGGGCGVWTAVVEGGRDQTLDTGTGSQFPSHTSGQSGRGDFRGEYHETRREQPDTTQTAGGEIATSEIQTDCTVG